MPNMETPTGATGQDVPAIHNPALDDLPPKMRVHALGKALGVGSKVILAALAELGETARSPQSSVSRDVAVRVAQVLAPADAGERETVDQEVTADAAGGPAVPLTPVFAPPTAVFLPPAADTVRSRPAPGGDQVEPADPDPDVVEDATEDAEHPDEDSAGRRRRRRGRRGRGRGRGGPGEDGDDVVELPEQNAEADAAEADQAQQAEAAPVDEDVAEEDQGGGSRRRRRRRRRKSGDADEPVASEDDPPNTVVHVRTAPAREENDRDEVGAAQSEVRSVRGSTRLEAKRQRRRDGREAGRRRVPILSEAEFLARREAVERTMVVRERGDRTQIAVLEDGVLVEHFVTSAGSSSLVGNVYLGRVQNVLPSMEAAFVDIGRGRNAVLYAGEVDWDSAGLEGKARKIEQALATGDNVLVQVTKDPVGHKGARLTTQISLPGRFLVYVPGGGATGISRKLPDTERRRLKDILKRIVSEDAGVIIRTASEGIPEDELGRDVHRLRAQWDVIKEKAKAAGGHKNTAPQLLYEEPDLLIKVVRDLFTEDFAALLVQGADAWDTIEAYVRHVAPDLAGRLHRHVGTSDVFVEQRIDEQITKALDRKVWLPSGGYLVIDRTEAMTVIDVNTGKFTGSGGNLEETVTRNNLEAAEEIVRQLRLRDIGGIIVIDFIDMVLESNRDLVLRRLTECLGRDRTRHQVAEVTSLGLVQMTRKRVGTGLLEAFSTPCEHCRGRGVVVSVDHPHTETGGGSTNGRKQQHRADAADQPDPAPAAVPDSAVPDSAVDRAGAEAEPERRHEPPPAAVAALGVGGVSEVSVPYEVPVQTVTENNGHHPAPASGPSGSSPSRRTRRVASRPAGPPVSGE